MSNEKSRHLFQITASRVKKGEEMGSAYLNTCKHRNTAVAECDVWEFEVTPIMLNIDDPESLFSSVDCTLWGAQADRLLAAGTNTGDPIVIHIAALYDIWNIVYDQPEEPTEYDMGVEFVGWVDWDKVIGFAGATATREVWTFSR